MDIASRIATYEERGFTTERAQVNVLMEAAAFAYSEIFQRRLFYSGEQRWSCFMKACDIRLIWTYCREERRRHRARRSLPRWSESLCP